MVMSDRHYDVRGKLPGSVWQIPSEPLKVPPELGFVEHYAAFSQEIPRRIIEGWCPKAICTRCGQGRRPVVDKERKGVHKRGIVGTQAAGSGRAASGHLAVGAESWRATLATITGYECDCTPHVESIERVHVGTIDGCEYGDDRLTCLLDDHYQSQRTSFPDPPWQPPPTRKAIVIDPFGGTGTTAMVARALGRIGLSFDLSHDYARLALWRIYESGDWAKLFGQPKKREVSGQGSLL